MFNKSFDNNNNYQTIPKNPPKKNPQKIPNKLFSNPKNASNPKIATNEIFELKWENINFNLKKKKKEENITKYKWKSKIRSNISYNRTIR